MYHRAVLRAALPGFAALALIFAASPAQAQQGWPIVGDNWSYYENSGGTPTYEPAPTETPAAPATPYYANYGDYRAPLTPSGQAVVGSPYSSPGQPVTSYQSYYNAGTMTGDRPAIINVRVPAQAQVWFDDVPVTTGAGAFRQFLSPPLEPGYRYSYEIRARWMDNGRPVERSQKVTFRPGEQATVNLMPK